MFTGFGVQRHWIKHLRQTHAKQNIQQYKTHVRLPTLQHEAGVDARQHGKRFFVTSVDRQAERCNDMAIERARRDEIHDGGNSIHWFKKLQRIWRSPEWGWAHC